MLRTVNLGFSPSKKKTAMRVLLETLLDSVPTLFYGRSCFRLPARLVSIRLMVPAPDMGPDL